MVSVHFFRNGKLHSLPPHSVQDYVYITMGDIFAIYKLLLVISFLLFLNLSSSLSLKRALCHFVSWGIAECLYDFCTVLTAPQLIHEKRNENLFPLLDHQKNVSALFGQKVHTLLFFARLQKPFSLLSKYGKVPSILLQYRECKCVIDSSIAVDDDIPKSLHMFNFCRISDGKMPCCTRLSGISSSPPGMPGWKSLF